MSLGGDGAVMRTFDAAPARGALLTFALQRQIPMTELAVTLSLPRTTLYRVLRATALPEHTADRVAVALGHHPCEWWPSWFADA